MAHMPDYHQLEELMIDGGVHAFILSWQKDTTLHRFARWIADQMFEADTAGPYVTLYDDENDMTVSHRYLPVDLAIKAYGINDADPEPVRPPDGEYEIQGNIRSWRESGHVANICYDRFMAGTRLSQGYDDLLTQIGEEVFHVMFHNRVAMAALNKVIAGYVSEIDPDDLGDDPELAGEFADYGRLRRRTPPEWVRRAVFFRDNGRCASCGVDLTRLLDPLSEEQYDHIIPLKAGGLNDITNLQLLCQPCNNGKSSNLIVPSARYRRLFKA